jgi:hypothetical protein
MVEVLLHFAVDARQQINTLRRQSTRCWREPWRNTGCTVGRPSPTDVALPLTTEPFFYGI